MISTDVSPLKCDICGKEVDGRYYSDAYGRVSCDRHAVCQCYCCGRIYHPQQCIEIRHLGLFCQECQKRKIDSRTAVRIAKLINEYYNQNHLTIPPYSLRLISEDKMVEQAESSKTLGLAFNRKPYEIHIIQNLSRTGFAGVLAHEVLHLWQYEHNFETSSLLCEGMCELGSYLFLKSISRMEADYHLTAIKQNEDKTYGGGFRLFYSIYLKFGWKGVVQALILRNGKL